MKQLRSVIAAVVLMLPGIARATVDYPSTIYTVLGFSADNKHVVYQRWDGGGADDCDKTELQVMALENAKVVESLLIHASGCDKIKNVSKRKGTALKKALLAKYGVKQGKRLKGAGGKKGAYRRLRSKELALEWKESGTFPAIDSEAGYSEKKKIFTKVSRSISLVKNKKRILLWSVHKRINPVVVCNDGSCLGWPRPSLASGQVSPDGRTFALVLNTGADVANGLDSDTEPMLITSATAARHNNSEGMRHYKKKRLKKALAHFAAAYELDPQNRYASYNLACVYARLGDAMRAVEMLRHHRKLRPDRFKERVAKDNDFDRVRQSAPFKALMARSR